MSASLHNWRGGTLVIASHNAGKVREIGELLAPLHIEVVSAAALKLPEPEETGSTFAENARIKSTQAAKLSGKPALSDDSGLVVPALDGAPGIYSARWAGPNKDFSVAMARVHQELQQRNVPQQNWKAYFTCVLALTYPSGETVDFEGRVDGILTFPPRGQHGFGYDPIFIPEGDTRSFGEMPAEEKHRISHRARAFAQLVDYLDARARKAVP